MHLQLGKPSAVFCRQYRATNGGLVSRIDFRHPPPRTAGAHSLTSANRSSERIALRDYAIRATSSAARSVAYIYVNTTLCAAGASRGAFASRRDVVVVVHSSRTRVIGRATCASYKRICKWDKVAGCNTVSSRQRNPRRTTVTDAVEDHVADEFCSGQVTMHKHARAHRGGFGKSPNTTAIKILSGGSASASAEAVPRVARPRRTRCT